MRMRAHLTREKEAGRGKGKGTRVDAVLVDSSVVFLLLLSQLHPDDNLLLCGQCLHVLQNRAISASALPSTNAPFRVSFFQQVQPRGTPVLQRPKPTYLLRAEHQRFEHLRDGHRLAIFNTGFSRLSFKTKFNKLPSRLQPGCTNPPARRSVGGPCRRRTRD